ncbi:ESX-1 secretion-associated protein EspI-like [Alexandromys fortis]|uniref:ESX-1 secretion-associated protein EspI-like n=1 Tax=Alexandromys fortis TaxID=100897 RepID=UPI002152A29C|nr:ESX-1 secretion-associated protein EspI-like [Microtus fortis]
MCSSSSSSRRRRRRLGAGLGGSPMPSRAAAPAPSRAEKETGRCGFLRDFLGFPHKRADSSDAAPAGRRPPRASRPRPSPSPPPRGCSFGLRGSKTNSRGAASSALCHRRGRRAALDPSVLVRARRLRATRPASGGGRAKARRLVPGVPGRPAPLRLRGGPVRCAPVSAPPGNAQEPRNELSPSRLSGTRVASKRRHTRMLPLLASASRESRDSNENKL